MTELIKLIDKNREYFKKKHASGKMGTVEYEALMRVLGQSKKALKEQKLENDNLGWINIDINYHLAKVIGQRDKLLVVLGLLNMLMNGRGYAGRALEKLNVGKLMDECLKDAEKTEKLSSYKGFYLMMKEIINKFHKNGRS